MKVLLWAVSSVVMAVMAVETRAEDCYDYESDLKEAIEQCEECSKKTANKADIGKCLLEKEGLVDESGNILQDKLTDQFLESFKGDDSKKEELKEDLEGCIKTGKTPKDSSELEEIDGCMMGVLVKHCPEAEEKFKEAQENERLRKCWGPER